MKTKYVKFGYKVKTGEEIKIPMAHMVITGLTQEAGKTTALMNLIKRSGYKALIIKTKRGEKAITEGTIIPPFYKENFDWEYACELLESSRKEKLKFERSWIIKYSKGATSLLQFRNNIDNALAGTKLRELEKSVLITLQAYLGKILPELECAPLSNTLDLQEGINIMDLERFKEETQSLIIRSAINEILNKEKNTIIVIPEAWKFIPEMYSNPVKRVSEAFIRQGATNGNYLWIDSQDVTGTSKSILKQVSNWILGYQREINEIERTLAQIPLPKSSKPKPEDIATLKLGQFYVATSEFTEKVYAQPVWLDDTKAIQIAKGEVDAKSVVQPITVGGMSIASPQSQPGVPAQTGVVDPNHERKLNELRTDFIQNRNDFYNKFEEINSTISKIYQDIYKLKNSQPQFNEDEIVMRVLQKVPMSAAPTNKDEIVNAVLARIPKHAGAITYEVAPLEKIKKDFLEEAKNKIISDIQTLRMDSKQILKYLESQGKGVKTNELVTKCFLLSDGGTQRTKVSNCAKELVAIEVIKKDVGGAHFPRLKDRIKELIQNHGATEQEIEQVYNHILMELLE